MSAEFRSDRLFPTIERARAHAPPSMSLCELSGRRCEAGLPSRRLLARGPPWPGREESWQRLRLSSPVPADVILRLVDLDMFAQPDTPPSTSWPHKGRMLWWIGWRIRRRREAWSAETKRYQKTFAAIRRVFPRTTAP